jgi:type I restriction enzyme S subunit
MVPSVRVGDLAEQVRGVTYGKDDASRTPATGYLPVLRAGNITDAGLAFDDLVYVPAAKISAKQKIRRGDIVIAASSGSLDVVGKAAPALAAFDGGFGAFCKVIRPNDKVDAGYLAQFFKTPSYRRTISSLAAGANINNLKSEHLDDLLLPLPPLPEQRRIAAILEQANALRAKRREALAQLDSLTQSIFIEMFGDYRTAGVPWPTQTIESIADDMTIGLVRSAAEFGPDFEVPYVRMNAIGHRGEFLPNLVMRTEVSAGEFERFELRPGDLLFNTRNSRELVGKTALFRESGRYVYNNNLMRIRFRHGVHPEYMAAAFQTRYIQQELETRKAGTTSVFAIYARELKTVPVPVPPFHRQETFATRIQAVESLKTTHRTALAELDALFASLQHRAFSGGL